MNSYQQKALKSAIANALMNSTKTWEETNLCIAYVHITALNPAFLLDLMDGMPAYFLFVKYHNQHPSSTEKKVLFDMLKERTPAGTTYLDQTMEHWQAYFEERLGPISSSWVEGMKFFESTTVHYETKNGKTTGTKEHVVVNGSKGTKTVEDIQNKNNSVESESLSKNEIKNIMNRVFVPNLFSSLHILNQSNLFRMNNNTKKNNNKNNSKKNSASNTSFTDVGHMPIRGNTTNGHASKNRTRKHRRQ